MDRTCYEISGLRFSLSTDDPSLRASLRLLYTSPCPSRLPCAPQWQVRQRQSPGGSPVYTVYEDKEALYSSPDRTGLIEHLEWTILRRLLRLRAGLLQLHAAGAARDGSGLILCGPPRSGKSTLALALLLDGWRCLSDEITLVEPGRLELKPFPRSFHLTAETLALFPGLARFKNRKGFVDNSGKMRFDPSWIKADWVSPPASPEWLVFPEYRPDCPGGLTDLGETEALSLLIDQTINLASHGTKGLGILLRLIRRCKCARLRMRDLRSGMEMLEELTRETYCETAETRR